MNVWPWNTVTVKFWKWYYNMNHDYMGSGHRPSSVHTTSTTVLVYCLSPIPLRKVWHLPHLLCPRKSPAVWKFGALMLILLPITIVQSLTFTSFIVFKKTASSVQVWGMTLRDYYCIHVCEQARWARSAGTSAIENLCIIIINN